MHLMMISYVLYLVISNDRLVSYPRQDWEGGDAHHGVIHCAWGGVLFCFRACVKRLDFVDIPDRVRGIGEICVVYRHGTRRDVCV